MVSVAPGSPVISLASEIPEIEPIDLDPVFGEELEAAPTTPPPVAEKKQRKPAKPRAPKVKVVVPAPDTPTPTESKGRKMVKPRVVTQSGMEWTSAVGTWDHEYEAKGRLIPISKLYLDLRREHGQARRLSLDHVNTIQSTFAMRPPVGPASCLVWNDGSMSRIIKN